MQEEAEEALVPVVPRLQSEAEVLEETQEAAQSLKFQQTTFHLQKALSLELEELVQFLQLLITATEAQVIKEAQLRLVALMLRQASEETQEQTRQADLFQADKMEYFWDCKQYQEQMLVLERLIT